MTSSRPCAMLMSRSFWVMDQFAAAGQRNLSFTARPADGFVALPPKNPFRSPRRWKV